MSENNDEIIRKLEAYQKGIEHIEQLRSAAQAQLAVSKNQYKELAVKVKEELGFDIKDLPVKIEELSKSINEEYEKLEAEFPEDVLSQYQKMTMDDVINGKVMQEIDGVDETEF
jgi:hypothetical protein